MIVPCTEQALPLLKGTFDFFVEGEDGGVRDIGNVLMGTFQEAIETFEGFPADGSDRLNRYVYAVRQSIGFAVTTDHVTCRNLVMFLNSSPANTIGGVRIPLDFAHRRENFRATLEQETCDGALLRIVIHRAQVVTPLDLLLSDNAFTAIQFTMRALRDASRDSDPYGYLELLPGDCEVS